MKVQELVDSSDFWKSHVMPTRLRQALIPPMMYKISRDSSGLPKPFALLKGYRDTIAIMITQIKKVISANTEFMYF
jgi:hypothetical protein